MKKTSAPVRTRFLHCALSATLLLPFSPRAHALNPRLDVSQYAHTAWKNREGFTNAVISAIAQSADGYLWLGTDSGLYRFDGVRVVAWQPPSNQHLPVNDIVALLAARDGTLWIGTVKGLASWKDGKLTQYPELDGMGINEIVQDGDGVVWAAGWAAAPPGRLCAIQHDTTQCSGRDGGLGKGPVGLFEDSKANLWVAVENGLWRWKPGPARFYPLAAEPMATNHVLTEGDDGALLIAMAGRVARFEEGKLENVYRYPNPARESNAWTVLRDKDGSLWIGTIGNGVVHVHQGSTDVFGESDGLSGSVVSALFQDREGDVWAATSAGLDRFREFSVITVSAKEGFLCASQPGSVVVSREGSIWQGGPEGLCRWHDGRVTLYHEPGTKLPLGPFGVVPNVQEVTASGFPKHTFMSVFEDELGRVWVAAIGGVGYMQNDRFTLLPGVPGGVANSISGDAKGNLWISNRDQGLLHIRGESLVEQVPWTKLGGMGPATALAVDPAQGGVWIGFKGGLAHFDSGHLSASYTAANGLGEGRVNDLRIDPDGTLWAATAGGLSLVKANRFATLSSADGLPCEFVHWSIEDNDHNLWLYMSCGLVRVAHSDLEAWRNDRSHRIQTSLFDTSDGVWTHGFSGHGLGPGVAKSPDGRLWFTSQQGLSVIDPHHLTFNRLSPPVHIEQMTVDRKTYETSLPSSASMRLPPQVRDLKVDYSAPSFVAPEKVQFRYKLGGWDREWQDAGTRRQAFYSNLPPGDYRFRVTASNNSGVWNEQGAALDFSIAPAYWQTNWFRALCLLMLLGFLWAVYQLRLRQLRQAFNMTLEARLTERSRVARELHDTLLQSFQGVLLRFRTVRTLLPARLREAEQTLDSAIEETRAAIREGRDAVQGLRYSAVEAEDFVEGLRALGEKLASDPAHGRAIALTLKIEGTPRSLRPVVCEEIHQIASEALRNAYRHAEASGIEVELDYGARRFQLRVRDDGKGINPDFLTGAGRPGHFGLSGMRERAGEVGGKLSIWSAPRSGTELQFSLSGAIAYVAGESRPRSWLRKRFFARWARQRS
jgi:signal transduction histidine kinase/ligand-binding sensor domain-containing protein